MWKWIGRVTAGLLLVALALALQAFWIEPGSLQITRRDIPLLQWDDTLTVAAISDLHVGSPNVTLARLRTIVEVTNAQRPDVVVLLGDFVIGGSPRHRRGVRGGTFVPPEDTAAELRNLYAPLGVYAVLGNHDAWFDGPRVQRALESAGIAVLENRAVLLEHSGRAFWLGGIADRWTGTPDIRGTLAQTAPGEPVVLITHNPDIFPEVPARASLMIAGHTHGGQVRLPFYGTLVDVSAISPNGYLEGLVEENGHSLYITHGVGTSIYPARFGVPPEIAILRLRPR